MRLTITDVVKDSKNQRWLVYTSKNKYGCMYLLETLVFRCKKTGEKIKKTEDYRRVHSSWGDAIRRHKNIVNNIEQYVGKYNG